MWKRLIVRTWSLKIVSISLSYKILTVLSFAPRFTRPLLGLGRIELTDREI